MADDKTRDDKPDGNDGLEDEELDFDALLKDDDDDVELVDGDDLEALLNDDLKDSEDAISTLGMENPMGLGEGEDDVSIEDLLSDSSDEPTVSLDDDASATVELSDDGDAISIEDLLDDDDASATVALPEDSSSEGDEASIDDLLADASETVALPDELLAEEAGDAGVSVDDLLADESGTVPLPGDDLPGDDIDVAALLDDDAPAPDLADDSQVGQETAELGGFDGDMDAGAALPPSGSGDSKSGAKKTGSKKGARKKLGSAGKKKAPKPKASKPPAPAKTKGGIPFICSECHEEFALPTGYSHEAVTCPECLHVGKRPDEDFLSAVMAHKAGEKRSLTMAVLAIVLLVITCVAWAWIGSPYSTMELSQNLNIGFMVGTAVFFALSIWLVVKFESNRWEVYF